MYAEKETPKQLTPQQEKEAAAMARGIIRRSEQANNPGLLIEYTLAISSDRPPQTELEKIRARAVKLIEKYLEDGTVP